MTSLAAGWQPMTCALTQVGDEREEGLAVSHQACVTMSASHCLHKPFYRTPLKP